AAAKLITQPVADKAKLESSKAAQDLARAEQVLAQSVIDHRRETARIVSSERDAESNESLSLKRLEQAELALTALTAAIKGKEREYQLILLQSEQYHINAPRCGLLTEPERSDKATIAWHTVSIEQNLGQPVKAGSILARVIDLTELRTEML